jgi:hypothetical protein
MDRDGGDRDLARLMREGDALWLHFFPIPPDVPKPVGDDSVLVGFFQRQISDSPGGLVEARWTQGKGSVPVARIIIKSPQEPSGIASGITYVGSPIVPFHACSWVVRVEAPETGMTGMREAVWAHKVSKSEGIGLHQLHDRVRPPPVATRTCRLRVALPRQPTPTFCAPCSRRRDDLF